MVASFFSHLWATSSRKSCVGRCQALGLCQHCVMPDSVSGLCQARPASQTRVLRKPATQGGHRGECPANEDSLIFPPATVPTPCRGEGEFTFAVRAWVSRFFYRTVFSISEGGFKLANFGGEASRLFLSLRRFQLLQLFHRRLKIFFHRRRFRIFQCAEF